MRIYIESTIPSYLVARPAQDILQAARQKLTKDWWASKRQNHELFTSQIVLDEITVGEALMAELRLKTLENMPLLDVTEDAEAVTRRILLSGLLPTSADRDAAHIALASARNGYTYHMELQTHCECFYPGTLASVAGSFWFCAARHMHTRRANGTAL